MQGKDEGRRTQDAARTHKEKRENRENPMWAAAAACGQRRRPEQQQQHAQTTPTVHVYNDTVESSLLSSLTPPF
jgi:hypothetical protein